MSEQPFDDPYFVTQHAIDRFQRRVCDLPRNEVIMEVQRALQYPMRVVEEDWDDECEVYFALYRHGRGQISPYYPVVGEGEGEWPAVMTIKGRGSVIHGKLCGNRNLIKRKGRAVILPEVGA